MIIPVNIMTTSIILIIVGGYGVLVTEWAGGKLWDKIHNISTFLVLLGIISFVVGAIWALWR